MVVSEKFDNSHEGKLQQTEVTMNVSIDLKLKLQLKSRQGESRISSLRGR